jgi:hypothetical protein
MGKETQSRIIWYDGVERKYSAVWARKGKEIAKIEGKQRAAGIYTEIKGNGSGVQSKENRVAALCDCGWKGKQRENGAANRKIKHNIAGGTGDTKIKQREQRAYERA